MSKNSKEVDVSSLNKYLPDQERCHQWKRLSEVYVPSDWRNVSKNLN